MKLSALAMPATALRAAPPWVSAFYDAYLARHPGLLEALLDDGIEWFFAGPTEQFDFFGLRRGKAEVIELVTRIIPCFLQVSDFEIEHLLVQGEHVVTYGRVRARQRETGRSLRFGYAHFLRFRDGKLISLRGLADSFDAVEQMVGHRIDVSRRIESASIVPEDAADPA